ncbi:MAG: SDR family oxidoreductase [Anaerolineae bacterium]|nr:SDR family oxidoreductase [Anaerolineae bacterium]
MLRRLGGAVLAVAGLRLFRKVVLAGRRLPVEAASQNLAGRVVIVTGASDGLGKATAKILAAMDAEIVFACRNAGRAQAAIEETLRYAPSIRREQLRFIPMDLADLGSVRAFAEQFRAAYARLDVLINNAGVGTTGVKGTQGVTRDGVEAVFQVNHLGHFYLTRLLQDMIVQCNGRVVNMSSFGHRLCADPTCFDEVQRARPGARNGYWLYGRSKLANILFTRELQQRLTAEFPQFKGDVFAVNPGRVYTSVWSKSYSQAPALFFALVGWLTMKTPLEGATTSVFCAVSPALQGRGGAYLSNCAISNPSPLAKDDALALALWEKSEQLLGF